MKYFQFKINFKNTLVLGFIYIFGGCFLELNLIQATNQPLVGNHKDLLNGKIKTGADQTESYIPLLSNKNVAIVANQTSVIRNKHLVDTLLSRGIKIKKIFAPEHGFRGDAANGEHVKSGKDIKTGLPIISLYGKHVAPTEDDLKGIDIVVFDIQDVGVRFYTYLSTLHYVMQSCAQFNKELMVLDRPNPNIQYIDGPVLDTAFKSMVGLHTIPLVHGMTLGELAKMIQGKKWIANSEKLKLSVIAVANYSRNSKYTLQIPPSPNLPTKESIILYPSLGLFEGTIMSMGRGTDKPFECFGAPWLNSGNYVFKPMNIPGKATNPPYLNQECRGILLTEFASDYLINFNHVYIEWFVFLNQEYQTYLKTLSEEERVKQPPFFNSFFKKLAGTEKLQEQIESGLSPEEIRKSWIVGIHKFAKSREPYLIYPEYL